MAINSFFIYFQSKEVFNQKLSAGEINSKSIVFIQDSREIYTHGVFYSVPIEIVNNLTTGGTDKALSAEQGKILKEFLDKKLQEDNFNIITSEEISDLFDNEGAIPPEGFHIDTELKLNSSNPVTNNAITKEFNNINEGKNNSLVKIEQTLTSEEQQQIQKNIAKGGYNRALYEGAGAVYNEDTGYYELNGLTDITEQEMADIYTAGKINFSEGAGAWSGHKARTNIPPYYTQYYYRTVSFRQSCNGNNNLEKLVLNWGSFKMTVSSVAFFCQGDYNLKEISGIVDISKITEDNEFCFSSVGIKIEKFQFFGLTKSLQIKRCKFVNYESLKYLIDNAANTKAITVTVHPTTFGYLDGSIQPTQQVGGTTAEWQQILTDAQAKNISFATE